MKVTQELHDAGQSLWLDNITRTPLTSGGLERYIKELSIAGLTSYPTILGQAIKNNHDDDAAIGEKTAAGKSDEALVFELAIEDFVRAADHFCPIHEVTIHWSFDGWVGGSDDAVCRGAV